MPTSWPILFSYYVYNFPDFVFLLSVSSFVLLLLSSAHRFASTADNYHEIYIDTADPDFYEILKSTDLVYIIGDLNARHRLLGHDNKNIRGELLATLINRGYAQHIGSYFPTYKNHRSSTSPDIILKTSETFHNTCASPGTTVTSSDYNYIHFWISSSPLQMPPKGRLSLKRADWDGADT